MTTDNNNNNNETPSQRRFALLPLPGETEVQARPVWAALDPALDPDAIATAKFEELSTLFEIQPRYMAQRISAYCVGYGHLKGLSYGTDPLPYHFSLARALIQRVEDREATAEEAALLAVELLKRLKQADQIMNLDQVTAQEILSVKEEDGTLWLDQRAFRFLRGLGPKGSEFADEMLQEAKIRLALYRKTFVPTNEEKALQALGEVWGLLWARHSPKYTCSGFVWYTGLALWTDFVKPRLGHTNTVPIQIFDLILSNYGKRGGELSEDGTALVRQEETVFTVPSLPPSLLTKVSDAIQALGSLDMARAIPWLIRRAWEQREQPNREKILISGGLEAFAKEAMKVQSNDGPKRAQGVLDAGQWFQQEWPGGFRVGGLWNYVYAPAMGQKPARIGITLGDFLLPHSQFGRDLEPWLVPVLEPPTLIGRPRDHAAQAFFAMKLTLEMVEHRMELLDGGAILTRSDIEQLALSVGLPLSTLYTALGEWSQPGESAFLEIEGDPKKTARYLLADTVALKPARTFLLKGAEMSNKAREKGRNSRSKKNARLLTEKFPK